MVSFSYIGKIDASNLLEALNDNPELWDEYPHRRVFEGSPHAEMTDIWARYGKVKNGDLSTLGLPHESIWYPSAENLANIKELCEQIYHMVDGEQLGGVLITKLPPNGKIKPHKDSGWHAGYYEKFHVAIKTNDRQVFGFDYGDLITANGDVNWFRNDVTHWVNNDSNEDRISMIVCIKTKRFANGL